MSIRSQHERDEELLMVCGAMGPAIHLGHRNRHSLTVRDFRTETCYCLWWIQSGRATLAIDGQRQRLELPAAVLQQPDGRSSVSVTGGSEWQRLVFDAVHQELRLGASGLTRVHADPELAQPTPEAIWGVALPHRVPAALLPSCRRMLDDCQAWWWRDDVHRLRANHRLGLWLLDLVAAARQPATRAEAPEEDWLAGSLRRIEERLELGLSVAELARDCGMSAVTFRRRFRARTGSTPQEWLMQARLRRAADLLRDGDQPIAAIAGLVGYASRTTFSRRFRDWAGCSPLEWRRRERQTGGPPSGGRRSLHGGCRFPTVR